MKIEFTKPRVIIAILVILYFIVVLNYPSAIDESIYSIVGSNIGNQTLYINLLDNKPPAIYVTLYLLSNIPLPFFIITRLAVLVTILATCYLLTRLFRSVFKAEEISEVQLFTIPFLLITYSIIFQGGIFPLTETFEILCVVIALIFFFRSQRTEYEFSKLIFSAFFFFLAFQFKQTAILFLLVFSGFLLYQKHLKTAAFFITSFVGLFLVFILLLNSFGILGAYLTYVWEYNFSWGGQGTSILTRLQTFSLILPLIAIAIPGMINAWKKHKNIRPILITAILLIGVTFVLIRGLSFRLYFLEVAPLLILFAPLTFNQIEKMKSNKAGLFKYKIILYFLIIIPILFLGFVVIKIAGLVGGYNINDEHKDIQFLNMESQKFSCENIYATVQYWHISEAKNTNFRTSLPWFWYSKNMEIVGTDLLTHNNTCYIKYSPLPIYSFGEYTGQKNKEILDDLAGKICKCNYYEQKTAFSAICYECKG